MHKLIIIPMMLTLSACYMESEKELNFQNFVAPKKIVTEKVPVHLPTPKIKATFNLAQDPKVIEAYQEYSKTGVAQNINSDGVEIMAYSPYTQFMLSCAPLHLCIIQLENGEKINNIDIGDSLNWLVTTSNVGTAQEGSAQITLKPKSIKLATDLVITTTKRTYNIALVSKEAANTRILSFYYPQESLQESVHQSQGQEVLDVIASSTKIDLNKINFNYKIIAEKNAPKPLNVFDDGVHTLIQMPSDTAQNNLPVLYLQHDGNSELVNYRYKAPYYVIDSVIEQAALIATNGKKTIIKKGG